MTKEEKQTSERFVVGQIPTETKDYVVDNSAEPPKVYTLETALAKIMNDLEELKKLL